MKLYERCLKIASANLHKHPLYEESNYLHWSFLLVKNRLIEWGTNRNGIVPIHFGHSDRIEGNEPRVHSELDCWNRTKGLIKDSPFQLINIRLNKRGQLRMAMPCVCCFNFLKSLNCSKVIFSTETGFYGQVL
jgi:hypothetical protein